MQRRAFITRAALVASVASLPACWISNLYSSINKYIPIALLAFDRILEILTAHGIQLEGLMDAVNAVKAALADIQAAILEYEQTHASDKTALIARIRTTLRIAEDRIEEFWRRLHLPQQLVDTIRALLGIILSTLAGFEQKLPGASVSRSVWAAPEARSVKKFREDFNHALDQHGESKYAI